MCHRLRSRFIRNHSDNTNGAAMQNVQAPPPALTNPPVVAAQPAPPALAPAPAVTHADEDMLYAQGGPAAATVTHDSDSDSSDGNTSEEDSDADSEESCETVSRPGPNFDTLLEVYRFITGCNNGRGLSNESTVWLLNILREERLNLELLRLWRSAHSVAQYGLSLMMARRQYEKRTVHVDGWPSPFTVMCTDGSEAVLELVGNPDNAEGFILFARQEYSAGGRICTTPETGTYWEEAQAAARRVFGPEAVVVPLILSSDATVLSGNERTKVWAVYISIANIPLRRRWLDSGRILLAMLPFPPSQMNPAQKVALFQVAMKVVLADLIVASHTGLMAKDPNGVPRFIVPMLFSYVADYPETCKVSCTMQLGSTMPCSTCYVGRDQLGDMDRDPAAARDVDRQEGLLLDPNEAAAHSTLCIPVVPFLVEGEGTSVSRRALVAVLQGHESCVRAPFHTDQSLVDFEEATRRFIRIPAAPSCLALMHRMVKNLEENFPRDGAGWNLVKIHVIVTHLHEAIKRAGLPREFSAAVYENAHIRTCKLPYRTSNRRDHTAAIAAHNATAAQLSRLSTALPAGRRNATALVRAIATGRPQLTRARRSLTDPVIRVGGATTVFGEINTVLGGLLDSYMEVMRDGGLLGFPAWVRNPLGSRHASHKAVALPAMALDFGSTRPHYARAATSMHGHPAFSYVEYETETGATLHGRLLLLLEAEFEEGPSDAMTTEVAVVLRLVEQGHDECTGCTRLVAAAVRGGLGVIPVTALRRAVHCVPSFVEEGIWFLNRWAYRCFEAGP
ncbi:unnamed protein product [Closterium sp. Yama58-4]|nr:unnamed protein product [Closterium sp. Yama58-4]